MKQEVPRLHLDYALVITLEKEAYKISLTRVQNLSPCNHEEADTRIMYHCTLEDKPAVVIASDTDILVLMVHVFASRLPDHGWFLQTKKNQLVNVSKIYDYIGNAVAITLPAMFVLTGCDTVSYFYRKSKEAILEHVLKQEVSAVDSIKFGRAYPSLGDVRRKAKEICPDNYLWFVCSNVCSNLLPVIVQKK